MCSNTYEQQKKEIETIKPRTIQVNLSDADCEKLAKMSAESGLTVSELLENFIADLLDNPYSNGEAEHDTADKWYDFIRFPLFGDDEVKFISYLLEEQLEDKFLTCLYEVDSLKQDIAYFDNLEKMSEEDKQNLSVTREYLDKFSKNIEDIYAEYLATYGKDNTQNKEEAIQGVIRYRDDLLSLKGEDAE